VTLGSLALDQFFAVILDPADPHYGYFRKEYVWPVPLDGATGPIYWHGAWSNSHPYVLGDGVSYEGSSYICIQANTRESPVIHTGTQYWDLLADSGDKGDPGNPGQAWPIGSVFLAVVSTSPATLLGYGTWSSIGAGKVLVGLDSGDTDFDTVEETGGAKTHQHAAISAGTPTGSVPDHGTAVTAAGAGPPVTYVSTKGHSFSGTPMPPHQHQAASNVMPYFVVYMWKRTA
jgi:hypothetical protein